MRKLAEFVKMGSARGHRVTVGAAWAYADSGRIAAKTEAKPFAKFFVIIVPAYVGVSNGPAPTPIVEIL